jgi:2-oxo-4-hydroxy-4-carboxy-5-ureidoimidazoline decarboxylase
MPGLQLAKLNQLSQEEFTRLIGPVFEHSHWIAQVTWAKRPFHSVKQLHQALCETVRDADEEKQLALISAHPDLVGRAALAGTLTAASSSEQASAGLNQLSSEELRKFQEFNQAYRNRFGFPFVICARMNKKEALLSAFPVRLQHSRQEEVRTALDEIFKIARLRLEDAVRG